MSLDKAIQHGKEKRKQYRGTNAVDVSCRNNTCLYCAGRVKYKIKRQEPIQEQSSTPQSGE